MSKHEPAGDSLTALLLSREIVEALQTQGVSVRVRLTDPLGKPLPRARRASLRGELHAAQQKLEHMRRLASIGALAAGVTHEARNLLTGSLGFAQLLRTKAHDASVVAEMARMIETELRRCTEVVASFLKLARSGEEPARELAVAEIVSPVERLVSHAVNQRGCNLRVELANDLPQVLGRAGDLQRVLINLVLNAADAADHAGGQIVLSARRGAGGNVELRVCDDGPGVAAELAERIFEPFFSTKTGTGTGLGLSISRSIAAAHGGKLELEPRLTPGAVFVLTLPPAGLRLDGRPRQSPRPKP
jgi:two-component system NtrC family sensor kinase